MSPLLKLAGIGSGAIVAASAVTWIALSQHAPAARPAAPADDASNNDVVVCVGSDSFLRTAPEGGGCPPNTRRIALSGPDHQAKDLTDDSPDPFENKKPPSSGPRRVEGLPEDIERRLDTLERAPLFEVVDKKGAVIFSVAPGSAILYNANGKAVACLRATEAGGYFTGRSMDGLYDASIGASGNNVGVRIREGGLTRVDLGRQTTGNYTLKFEGRGGGMLAGIGESRAGTGVLVVSDSDARTRVSMALADGKGSIGLFNSAGTAILNLTEKSTGGGLLVIGDRDGTGMVKMSNNDERYGVVMTGPRAGFPYVPASGLPGSYFLGCAGGSSCQP